MNHNIYAHIQSKLIDQSEKDILITHTGISFTGSELEAYTEAMARVILNYGVTVGDRVSVQVEKSWVNVVLYLSVIRIGAVFLPLNSAYTDSEIDYFLNDAIPKLHVCSEDRISHASSLKSKIETLSIAILNGESGPLFDEMQAELKNDKSKTQTVDRRSDDLAAIIYTSGTTGQPKGAMISHGNLKANAAMLTETWGYSVNDILLHALPLFHVHGLFVALNLAFINGGTIILLPKFSPEMVIRFLPNATILMGVPTYYTRLLADKSFTSEKGKNLRLYISGSAPLLVETSNAFFDRTGHRILERYGMTETGMSCSNPLYGDRRAGTVGFPLPGVEVRCVDDNGNEVPRGEIGSLEVRGNHVFAGYWNLPDKTAYEFRGNWFITGDLAIQSEDGYISIVGRSKDLIISGGLNIYPKEIEDILNKQNDVVESAVIGAPHPDFGEGIVAILIGENALDMEKLEAACRVELAGFKIPRKWRQIETFPRNTMGKVQKTILRDRFKDCFV